jgi:glycerophosphoryl diester phosphodiesterase
MAVSPFIVAHRAGNDLDLLRRAEGVRPRLIEADVHLSRGRLEVRHLKTLGPLPVLWDRWYLASLRTPRLELAALLAGAGPETALMLDLKGRDVRLSQRVAAELARRPSGADVTVCSRSWRLLEAFRDVPGVRAVHSVGSRRQLRALRRRFAGRRLGGISIHQRLLDPATVADLRARAEMIVTWPVATLEEARRLGAWGVDGVITEQFEALAPALTGAAA